MILNGLPWKRTSRSFCCFWDFIQVLHFGLFCWPWWLLHFFWMASLTRWTWVWANSRSWWWTGRPGMLRFTGSQSRRRLSDWSDLIFLESSPCLVVQCHSSFYLKCFHSFVFPFLFCIVTLKCICLYIIYCNNCIILITFFNFDNSSYVGFLSWWITLSGLFLTRVKGSKDKCLWQFLQHICQWVWITFSVDFPHESSL